MKAASLIACCSLAAVCAAEPARAQDAAKPNGAISRSVIISMDLGEPVAHAPYTAEGTTTTSSILPSGSHASGMSTSKVYRDSQGRERREQTLIGIALLGTASQPIQPIVSISDPLARVTYTLDLLTRTARRVRLPSPQAGQDVARAVIVMRDDTSAGPARPLTTDALDVTAARRAMSAAGGVPGAARYAVQMLGAKAIDGEMATGRVTTSTLGDGTEVIDEQWTSTDLKVTVMSKHHDPRTGDVLYKLTNIVRGEPDAALFTVPRDYTIVDDVIALPRTPRQ